ncbi:3-octaprenyl-4-hydroxybenzoate carboxy-lyase [delta proteobacterium NaphS2]|nr:3-octaprenyl-4-hydroxybenzoate carboxy-lyase [delta proteobacterium NaphS2]
MSSLRDLLEDLEDEQELNIIEDEVDWNLEAAAICAMNQRTGGPAVQFNNVKGYPDGKLVGSLFTGPGFMWYPQVPRMMHGRIAMGLGLEKDIKYEEFQETIIERKKAPIRSIEVDEGPCHDVIIEANDVDLYKYPIPRLHEKDGGRYLTSHTVHVYDAESQTSNSGVYRLMLGGRNKLVHGSIPRRVSPTGIEKIVAKAAKKNEAVPFAIVIGSPPPVTAAGAMNLSSRTDEYAVAGGLGANPVALVKAKLSDILVPVDAEMVLEGEIVPGATMEEGPFGSISYYTDKMRNFIYDVQLITHQEGPILPFVAEGAKPSDSMCLLSALHSTELLEYCRNNVFGSVINWVTLPVEAKLNLAIVCLGRQALPGFPGRIARAIYSQSPYVRKTIFVDPDVQAEELSIALNDRVNKVKYEDNVFISPMGKPLGLTENHGFGGGDLSSTMTVDATWRFDRPGETKARRNTFEAAIPKDVRDRVVALWKRQGISPDPVVMD